MNNFWCFQFGMSVKSKNVVLYNCTAEFYFIILINMTSTLLFHNNYFELKKNHFHFSLSIDEQVQCKNSELGIHKYNTGMVFYSFSKHMLHRINVLLRSVISYIKLKLVLFWYLYWDVVSIQQELNYFHVVYLQFSNIIVSEVTIY